MLEGVIGDLHREGGVIVDIHSANGSLATKLANGTKVPLKIGDSFEINNHRAVVVGICEISLGFYPQPIIFTTNSSFQTFTGSVGNRIGFIAVKTAKGSSAEEVCKYINGYAVLDCLTRDQFRWRIAEHFLKTGILINFGLSVALGLIIGFSISGQIFYIMTLQSLMYYALIKALGANQKTILSMILFQALIVGAIGFLLGTGTTILWGFAIKHTTLAFLFPWHLLLFTGFIVFIICIFTATLSIRKVFRTDPKLLLGN